MPVKKYFQHEIEFAPVEQLFAWQDERLRDTVKWMYENVPNYRNLMDKRGVKPEDIRGRQDLHLLPFLDKNDLREAYPYGLLARHLFDCVSIQSTRATTGKGVVRFIRNRISFCGTSAPRGPSWGLGATKTMWSISVTAMTCFPGVTV